MSQLRFQYFLPIIITSLTVAFAYLDGGDKVWWVVIFISIINIVIALFAGVLLLMRKIGYIPFLIVTLPAWFAIWLLLKAFH